MNGYVTFYEQHRVEVYADNAVEAQAEALKVFSSKYPRRKIKSWHIAVVLAERNGEQVVHSTAAL